MLRAFNIAVGIAVLLVLIATFMPEPKPRPGAITRHILEHAERISEQVMDQNSNETAEVTSLIVHSFTNSGAFENGYAEVRFAPVPQILDAWKTPLIIQLKSELTNWPALAASLLAKTNKVLIWSAGPNRKNENGYGDDIVLLTSPPSRRVQP